jgi:hypothetical protein
MQRSALAWGFVAADVALREGGRVVVVVDGGGRTVAGTRVGATQALVIRRQLSPRARAVTRDGGQARVTIQCCKNEDGNKDWGWR